jgi:Bacterial membrane protein YfhO
VLPPPPRRADRWVLLLLAAATLLPDLAAALPLRSYYFRDFTVTFYPLRVFTARQLAAGKPPFWNPYIFEGSFGLPAFYPPDLLYTFGPAPEIVSWLLTLHLPLAGIFAYMLLRELGARPSGAFVGGATYALGGLALSSLNLYVFLEALALAPLLVLTLRRAAERGGRWVAGAGVVFALCLATLAVEFVAQALALGCAFALRARPRREGIVRAGLALALGLALAAVPVLVMLGVVTGGPRGAGLPRDVALGNAAHPLSFLQVLIPELFGYLSPPAEVWWGGRFFTKGLPYFLSLYLGPVSLALAVAGCALLSRRQRLILLGALGVAVWYALGERGGLATVLSTMPGLGAFRFPVKALFLPHFVIAILAGLGADGLARGSGWRRFGRAAGLAAGIAGALALAAASVPSLASTIAEIEPVFLPLVRRTLVISALKVALIAATSVWIAITVARSGLTSERGVMLLAAVVVVDLVRVGAGMNPQTSPAFFRALPQMAGFHLDQLDGGRVFSYGVDHSPAFRAYLREGRPGRSVGAFFVDRQLLGPYTNVLDRVEVPEATDLTAFTPRPRELGPEDYEPARIGQILPWLRNAAVSRVLSLDPLEHADLSALGSVPLGVGGLVVRVYGLRDPWPRAYLACRLVAIASPDEGLRRPLEAGFEPARDVALQGARAATCQNGEVRRLEARPGEDRYHVKVDGAGYLVTRDSYAAGWTASVDGALVGVLRANGKHRAVPVPAGEHEVTLRYRAPGLVPGLLITLVALGAVSVLVLRPVGGGAASEAGRG